MKRDMELTRKMLLAVESWPPDGGDSRFAELGYPQEAVMYNAYQAIQAGLVEGGIVDSSSGLIGFVTRLTPSGHDFLDNARNQYIWDEVMNDIKERGIVSVSIDIVDIVKDMLNKAIRKKFDK